MNNFFKMFKDDLTTLLRFNVRRHGTGVVLEIRRFSRVKCVDLKHGKAQADGMVLANQGAAVLRLYKDLCGFLGPAVEVRKRFRASIGRRDGSGGG